jgi:3-hydroxyisobutyrate dehydrogenase-like beta-hydroxyacid dehydrogenase
MPSEPLNAYGQVMPTTVGVMHPGEMGAAIGACLVRSGTEVLWCSSGRSAATVRRASEAGLTDVGRVDWLVARCDIVLSVCPPQAAADVARELHGFRGIFVEANAVSPRTVRGITAVVSGYGASVVDGSIVGPPPAAAMSGQTRFYLAGSEAGRVVGLFKPTPIDARVVDGEIGAASALKMAYAAWTKGTAALLLAIRALARASNVEADLLREWDQSQPELPSRTVQAGRSAAMKGWRWIAEMEQIAATFTDAGLPDGFHRAAAEVYRRSPRLDPADAMALELVIEAIRRPDGAGRT